MSASEESQEFVKFRQDGEAREAFDAMSKSDRATVRALHRPIELPVSSEIREADPRDRD